MKAVFEDDLPSQGAQNVWEKKELKGRGKETTVEISLWHIRAGVEWQLWLEIKCMIMKEIITYKWQGLVD